MTKLERQLMEAIASLSYEQQGAVLKFVQRLTSPRPQGVSGDDLIRRVQETEIEFSDEESEEMLRAIEEGCQRIDRMDD
ncbi:MAG TPA: hypothetical protein P5081_23175 [Phycisphaerae bacterium]|nr:hypothetical protein [Phycisphaerae bacterium]HRW55785.1 hypothetical protein [Phycisphaerae bacterium]